MSEVLAAVKWPFDILAKRISAFRSQYSFSPSKIYSSCAYDESQMKEADEMKRQQKSEIEYDC